MNFANFVPLTALLIALIGLSVAHASGLIDTFIKRSTIKIDNKYLTFFIILIATISSLITEVGYVILIPLAALVSFFIGGVIAVAGNGIVTRTRRD